MIDRVGRMPIGGAFVVLSLCLIYPSHAQQSAGIRPLDPNTPLKDLLKPNKKEQCPIIFVNGKPFEVCALTVPDALKREIEQLPTK